MDVPVAVFLDRVDERRNLARRAVGQHPGSPVFRPQAEAAPQLDRVHAEAIQHFRLDDRELLHEIVNIDIARCDAQVILEFRIGNCHDARRAVPAQVNGNPIRLPVIHRRQYALAKWSNDPPCCVP